MFLLSKSSPPALPSAAQGFFSCVQCYLKFATCSFNLERTVTPFERCVCVCVSVWARSVRHWHLNGSLHPVLHLSEDVNLFPRDFDNITKDSHVDDITFSFSCALFSVFLCRGERIWTTVWEPERKSMRGEHEGQRAARSREAWDPQLLDQPYSKRHLTCTQTLELIQDHQSKTKTRSRKKKT